MLCSLNHARKIHDQRKTVVQTKLKQHAVTSFYYLLHMQELRKNWELHLKHNRLMKRIISFLHSSQCLGICNVLALATTSCSVQYGYEIFVLERKCYCDN